MFITINLRENYSIFRQQNFIDDFSNIKSDFEKLKIAYTIVELTNLFSREGQTNDELFELVYQSLISLNKNLKSNYFVLVNFLIHLCAISGYPIYTGQCPLCHNSINLTDSNFTFTRNYGIVCLKCRELSNNIINLGEGTKKVLALLLEENVDALQNDEEKLTHLYLPILDFLQYHVEEIKKIKSLELF